MSSALPIASSSASVSKSTLPPLLTPETFPFPYARPYGIQLDLMRTVFRAIEDGKIAIVESPTGTGKSLSLLSSTLTWLTQHTERLTNASLTELRSKLQAEDPDEPGWVIEHSLKAKMKEMENVQRERKERLDRARERERKARREMSKGAFGSEIRKKIKLDEGVKGKGKERDEDWLPDDESDDSKDDGPYLSKEVRDLMNKYEASRPKAHGEEEEEEDVPKIYYTSRTHTQLRQLTSELLKTSFPIGSSSPDHLKSDNITSKECSDATTNDGVSLVPLASRRQLCINDKVRNLAKAGGGGDERLNEACLDMQKTGKTRCEYLPGKDEEWRMLDARDSVLASVKDIEDIVTLGKKSCVCPYYSTRRAVKQSQIVTLPYNLLLQKNAREALDINLKDQVVVIDEAHNLIDTLLSIHSTTITSTHLSSAIFQLTQYMTRFSSRLKSSHLLSIKQVLSLLQGLLKTCEQFFSKNQGKAEAEVLDANTFILRAGGASDQLNPLSLVGYLKESKLARKVSGFSEHLAEQAAMKETKGLSRTASTRHASIAAFHQVEAFLLSLVDAKDDGRVILSVETPSTGAASKNTSNGSGKSVVTIKYVLLNPAERFKQVVEEARSVILAGGTMEPITDFLQQLFPSLPPNRFSTLSCKHVIPKSNLLTQVVSQGPRKVDFEFKFGNRDNNALLAELGSVIQSTIGLVPDGVVVFLPSYAFLDKIKNAWGPSGSGLLQKLGEKKDLFYEPQISGDVDDILRDYALAISASNNTSNSDGADKVRSRKTGALLFAVVGGKLSEGINFSDRLGRCVIMVGLPFANVGSVELKERMRYIENLAERENGKGKGKEASREMYENLCMRAVNQSIGRSIRHANDYAIILLVDKRFNTYRIKDKLPKWIGEDVKSPSDWGGVVKGIAGFFREKRERERVS